MEEPRYNVSPAIIEVLRRANYPVEKLEAQGLKEMAKHLRRAIAEAGEGSVSEGLEARPDVAEPYETPRLRVVR